LDELKRRIGLARRALATLDSVLREPPSDVVRDAAIQRFEYSFETTWKAAQRYLREREGLDAASPSAAVRHCHAIGLLDEGAARLALEMVGDRNLTVHTYNEPLAQRIFSALPRYARLLEAWVSSLDRT
jgi:nucleotidyltransferase substrate binding protein (TIGR01987 family)